MTLRSDIERAKELDAKATPAPWEVGMRNGANGRTLFARDGERKASSKKQDVAHWDSGICDVHGLYLNMRADEQPAGEPKSNAALIAHYRTLVPRMIEQIERMEGALRQIKALDYANAANNLAMYKANTIASSTLAELDKE